MPELPEREPDLAALPILNLRPGVSTLPDGDAVLTLVIDAGAVVITLMANEGAAKVLRSAIDRYLGPRLEIAGSIPDDLSSLEGT